MVRAADGKGVLLVGASGTIYAAPDQLAAISGNKPPPQPLRSISAGKAAIVGVAADGTLLRTVDAGASWTKADVQAGAGPS